MMKQNGVLMKITIRILIIAFFGSVLPFSTPSFAAEKETTLDKHYYENNVLPLLEQKCTTRCHDNPFSTFEDTDDYVEPGDPMASELYRKALGQDSHEGKYEPEEVAVLKKWIEGATAKDTASASPSPAQQGPKLMGRVDLTTEFAEGKPKKPSLGNNHFL